MNEFYFLFGVRCKQFSQSIQRIERGMSPEPDVASNHSDVLSSRLCGQCGQAHSHADRNPQKSFGQ
jgi:hypothetical protein